MGEYWSNRYRFSQKTIPDEDEIARMVVCGIAKDFIKIL